MLRLNSVVTWSVETAPSIYYSKDDVNINSVNYWLNTEELFYQKVSKF